MGKVVSLPPSDRVLADGSMPGGWWHEDEQTARIVCDLCPRACHLKAGDRGFCFVRQNLDGRMVLTTYGRSTGFCIDPIEKKPLNHFYPGTSVLSFGTAGCNLGCKFCQNWDISKSREVERLSARAEPEAIAEAAVHHGCRSVAFTYNDPVIWAEYAIDTARACHERGLKTVAVTAGYVTPAARSPFFEVMDAANVDLKAFSEAFYREITYSHLQPVLDTLAWLSKESDCWFEITNLVIPEANDSLDEIRRMAGWVLEHCGDLVPVHFTAFHPDFRMRDRPPTPHETLLQAHEAARAEGLKYVYTGNVHDAQHQSTRCPHCGRVVIERSWYELGAYHLKGATCGHCGGMVAGRFDDKGPGKWGRRRVPVDIAGFNRVSRSDRQPRALAETTVSTDEAQPAGSDETRPADGPTAPLVPSEPQRQRILEAASEYVAAAILKRPVHLPDPSLAGAADLPVTGAYVTLKRGGHLRACTGNLGRKQRLVEALKQSARHTATEDRRLPPISPTEFPYINLSVNLLFNLRQLDVKGRERVAAIEVGRHGLRLQRGDSGGLLLPIVATEHGWDPESFLRHACRKAGLPSTAWEDDETAIFTFESVEFGGPFVVSPDDQVTTAGPSAAELQTLAEHARANVIALARGLTPSFYAPGASDGHVSGLALTLDGPGLPGGPWHLTQLSIRPGLALQATLYGLCESAARALAAEPRTLESVHVGVTVLTDPALHGTLASPDLRDLEPADRALVAVERERVAWVFSPSSTPEELLELTRNRLDARDPERSGLYSLAVRSTELQVAFDTRPRAIVAGGVRPPAVAGSFYPADPADLGRQVEALLAECPRQPAQWAGAMVPHAGLVYSGRLAAAVLSRIAIPDVVLVIGPKHTRLGVDWAVAPHKTWSIPGATIASDPELAQTLVDAIPGLKRDAAAHEREHAIEVELPFLARLAPEARVVGIALGGADWTHCRQFAEGLAAVIRALPRPPLLLISSDMNHYATDRETRILDEIALKAMERLDPKHLLDTVTEHDISMCGLIPAVIVMETLRLLGGLSRLEHVGHATSTDVNGDTGRAVGYAGVLLN